MKKKLIDILLVILISIVICYLFGFILSSFINNNFKLIIQTRYLTDYKTIIFTFFFLIIEGLIILFYYYKHYWLLNSKNIMKGKTKDLHLNANLETSRFQTESELKKNYKIYDFKELKNEEIVGSLVKAEYKGGKLNVVFTKPAHTLVIGTTGSGKTTTFVNPMIQILSETHTKPSMFISDPKGELYADHVESLKNKGYEVKVIDLRNPYNSIRWNPLERAYLYYQRMIHLEDEVIVDEENGCYIFEDKKYYKVEEKDTAIQVRKQQLYDIVYEDLHDITTVLCPITNKNEPMWESGAKNFILAIALAMLEDSENIDLGLTKDKFNFYSITKVATKTDNECEDLINYFKNRTPLSKAVSLSKQVLDASDKTRSSYLSTTFDKLSMFSDLSLCALTSENEIEFGSMGEKPIALFLQIPDEKETRHTLASMVILQAYKELVYKANSYDSLSLPKPVYFILDEFGNLPKVHKLEQMITVGRSRNIWMNLVVQSYAQLAKVYEEKSADIIKSNCNIQVFIGTTDYKTIEEFSKRCGNFSMVQRNVGFNSSKGEDINSNSSIKERPLIYPSELQMLNRNGNYGNAIVTVFGYHPIKSRFTPSFECDLYQMKRIKQVINQGRYFDEEKAFYDMSLRNHMLMIQDKPRRKGKGGLNTEVNQDKKINKVMIQQLIGLCRQVLDGIVDEIEIKYIISKISKNDYQEAIDCLEEIKDKKINEEFDKKEEVDKIITKIKNYFLEKQIN